MSPHICYKIRRGCLDSLKVFYVWVEINLMILFEEI